MKQWTEVIVLAAVAGGLYLASRKPAAANPPQPSGLLPGAVAGATAAALDDATPVEPSTLLGMNNSAGSYCPGGAFPMGYCRAGI